MSSQTIAKLKRLLAIEVAKRQSAEAERDKAFRAYSDNLGRFVIADMRIKQAMAILAGEEE